MIHGQYETSCVEGMNALIKHTIDIRGADPITALRRWINWDKKYYEDRVACVSNASGSVTPRMKLLLQKQRLAITNYGVTNISADKRRACVTYMRPNNQNPYCHTFETEILTSKVVSSGMKVTCTCKRHIQSILCDHVAAHIEHLGQWQLVDFVHKRDTMAKYKSQYPSKLPEYRLPCFNELSADERLCLPVVNSVRRGRPAKNRFISAREKMITKAKKKLKRKGQKECPSNSLMRNKRIKPNSPCNTSPSPPH